MKKLVVYDIEILKNFFSVCFIDYDTKKKEQFVLFSGQPAESIEALKKLINFLLKLKKHGYTLVGFNNLNFDAQLIELILSSYRSWFEESRDIDFIITEIYDHAQYIINLPEEEKFANIIPEWKLTIPQIDLFKQKHYDGKAKMGTSLKWIQFSIRYPNVEEMPIHHESMVTVDMIEEILSYNWNDVLSTLSFFEKIMFETDLRKTLTEKYGKNLLNASEPRLAKEIFGKLLCEDMKISYAELKKMRTYRKQVAIKDILFPYISFKTPDLEVVHQAFKELVVDVSKGGSFSHTFNYHGIETVLGLGGLHACCSPGVYKTPEGYTTEDIDVVSFYPNLAIENNIQPAQFEGTNFLKLYKYLFDQRKLIPKKDPINYVYKIILNSTYGLSKEVNNSYLYDPAFTYGITINGQLSLLMLIEMLVMAVPSIKILQENTDGTTIVYKDEYKPLVKQVCEEWKKITKLELEHAFYKEMIIRDVNNYIGVYPEEGKTPKKKGAFETELDYHKNPSFLIVPKAIEAYFVKGVDYKKFILEHEDIYDFLGAAKKKSNFEMNLYKMEAGNVLKLPQQKVTRYFVSHQGGGQLVKEYTDKRKADKMSVVAGYQVTPLNKVEDTNIKNYSINYSFYIREAEKIIFEIEKDKKQLFLF